MIAKQPTVHPGEVLQEALDERGMSQVAFARRVDYSPKHVSQIINGKARVTAEAALRFERVLGISASFWMALQSDHELAQARRRRTRPNRKG